MKKVKDSDIPPEVKQIIKATVEQALQAGKAAKRQDRTPYQRTEKRLYGLPALIKRIAADIEELARLEAGEALPERSKDLVRFTRGGSRVSPEDKLDAVMQDMRANIAANEHEVKEVKWALEQIKDDYYYPVITGRYFEGHTDEAMAEGLYCASKTIQRQRSRLVSQISVLLYGVEAVT